jgi:branched-subunit amino acid aminotransferase/4-amino-4-deoxychorismate lyase
MSEPLAFLDGRFLPFSQAKLPVTDGGFLQGVTVAEQLRTFNGQLFRLTQHLSRLRRSLDIIQVELPVAWEDLADIAEELIARNFPLLKAGDDLGLTIFVTPGTYATYRKPGEAARPLLCVHTAPVAFDQFYTKYTQGDALWVTPVQQVPAECWPPELKCRSRMHYFLADQAARKLEAGARALLLDADGFVTESSTANLVAYRRDEGLLSPPKEHILPGISVAVLQELAAELGIPFQHRPLRVADLATADELLLTSTSPCVWPVLRLNGQPIGAGQPGPIGQQLLAAWSRLVGIDIAAQSARFVQR